MSELPKGWAGYQLGEVNEYVSGNIDPSKTPETIFELYSVPSFPAKKPEILSGRDIGSTKQIVFEGDVLLCKINPRINRVWQVGPSRGYPQIASSEWIVIRQPAFNSRFLVHQLSEAGFRDQLCAEVSGVGGSLTRAQPKKVATYRVLIAPEREQARIAHTLDGLLAQVDTLKARLDALPALIKRFRQSVLSAAVTRQLTTIGLEEPRTSDTGNETEVAQFREVRLGDVATDFSYGTSAKSQKAGSVPVLRMGNIQNGKLDWHELVYTSDCSEIEKYKLSSGDILFNRTNSPELVGKTAIYKDVRPAIYAGYLIRVRCGEKLLPDYLNHCLNSPQGRDYCWQVKTDGVSQSNINAKKLADFRFDLPSIEVQAEIVRRVEQLFAFADQLEARLTDARARVDALTQSILAKAFRGELVPQDPADEPASVLHERITAQRAAAPKPKRGRKSV